MPKLSAIPAGAQIGNRLTDTVSMSATNDVSKKADLNATISRIKDLRQSYDRVAEESKRIGSSIHGLAKTLSQKASQNAQEIKSKLDGTIADVRQNSAHEIRKRTVLLEVSSQPGKVEAGKGSNINLKA